MLDPVPLAALFAGLFFVSSDFASEATPEALPVATTSTDDREDDEYYSLWLDFNKIASGLANLGKFEESEVNLRRALAVAQSHFVDDPLLSAISFNDLAHISMLRRDLDAAESFARRGLKLLEAVKGFDVDTGEMNKVGYNRLLLREMLVMVLIRREKFGEARSFLKPVLDERLKHLKPGGLDVAMDQALLAEIERGLGRPDLAEPIYRRSLAICHEEFPRREPEAECLAGIGRIHRDRKEWEKARASFEAALEILEQVRGRTHDALFDPLLELARIEARLKNDAASLEYYERCLSVGNRFLPAEHPDLKRVAGELAVVKQRMNVKG